MKKKASYLLPLLGLSALLTGTSFAVVVVAYDFESESNGDYFSNGGVSEVTGWSQDTANPVAFGDEFPLAYITPTQFTSTATNSGHLGTQLANTPDNASTSVSASLGLSGAVPIGTITLNLAIVDNAADSFTGRDQFSVGVTNAGSTSIAQIDFIPNSGDDTLWDISLGVNGAAVATTGATMTAGAGYVFSIVFADSGTSFSYGASTGGVAGSLIADLGIVASGDFGGIEMTHTPLAAAGTSANELVFDNITISDAVPEPSSSLLILSAVSGLFLRRRR